MDNKTISSQASKEEGSETISQESRGQVASKRPTPVLWGEDIVHSSRKREAVLKRLFRNIKVSDKECWEWQGATTNGYGTFRDNEVAENFKLLVTRVAWVVIKGEPIPDNLHVLHRCDNPKCFNPDHLFLGTHQDNMKDRDNKGRTFSGELVGTSVYSTEDIMKAKEMLEQGMTGRAVSEITGISPTHISRIRKGYSRVSETQVSSKNWVHANRKYSDEQLTQVAELLKETNLSAPQIFKLTGVKPDTVKDMKRGKTHKRFMKTG